MLISEMQTYYDRRASEYDTSMGYNLTSKAQELEPVIAIVRQTLQNRKVLELACGPGYWTQHAAAVTDSLLATDFNESTLLEAKKKDFDSSIVSFKQADAYAIEEITGDFDAVFAVDWLAHVPRSKMKDFLASVIKRIPKGSPTLFIDQLPKETSVSGVFDEDNNHLQERVLSDGAKFQVIKHFFSDTEIEELFHAFGGEFEIRRMAECRRISVTYWT